MKKSKKYFTMLVIALSLVIFSGCDDNYQNCEELINIEYKPLKIEGGVFFLKNIEANKEIKLIITSQVDYEKFVTSNVILPQIDFNKNILLCGRIYLSSCGILKNQSIIKSCNNVTYKIHLENLDCHKPEEIVHFAIIPKNFETFNIIFESIIK